MSVLPTPKLERWKYSNLATYVAGEYSDTTLDISCDIDAKYITKSNIISLPWGRDTYNDMMLWDGQKNVLSIHIPVDMHVDKHVNLSLQVADNIKKSGHVSIHLESGASLTIFDDVIVDGWANRSMTITLDEGAKLTHIRTGSGEGIVTNLTQISLGEKSIYNAYALNTYGSFMFDHIHSQINGTNSECSLSGTMLLSDNQHVDTCILIEHIAPGCVSNQNYRNLLDDNSKGVFQGKVHVHQSGQQTDGYQLCNSVLLSDHAEMNTKPELEIYADDVKCSHGATTAQADEEPLFYLQQRGIPADEARKILLQAFLCESLEKFEEDIEIYELLSNKIESYLNA